MHVHFLGAAQTVTGSCHVIETKKVRFAVDFGMYQGNRAIEERNQNSTLYNALGLDFILLTHAHIDHSGLLPKAVKDGFNGTVYCTEPTAVLLDVMLQDSAHIQEMDAIWQNKKRARAGLGPVEPLYAGENAKKTVSLLKPLAYDYQVALPEFGVRFSFRRAGHILGASFLEIEVEEDNRVKTFVFSGDLGRSGALLMLDPEIPAMKKPDYLFLESTYGDRNHKSSQSSMEELADAIKYSYTHGEKVIIPSFAIERTQEILFLLHRFYDEGKIPKDMPVYVDSPLAIKATEIFKRFYSHFETSVTDVVLSGKDPFSLPSLKYTPKPEESQELNTLAGPAIVISASGMCNAGRIRHHLRHNLWRPGASIVFTGYQAIGTPGRRIVDGAKTIGILGENVVCAAKIYTIGGLSAHAGQDDLVRWAQAFVGADTKVFLVHGEVKAQNALKARLESELGVEALIPDYLEKIELGSEGVPVADYQPVPQEIDWDAITHSLRVDLEGLEHHRQAIAAKDPKQQIEILDKITELRRLLQGLIHNSHP